jgi:flagellar biosynthesis protein FliR
VLFMGYGLATAAAIALPVVLVLLLVQVVTGVLSRSAPALNLFALGLPAGVLAGIAALIIAMPLIVDQFSRIIAVALAEVAGLLS